MPRVTAGELHRIVWSLSLGHGMAVGLIGKTRGLNLAASGWPTETALSA